MDDPVIWFRATAANASTSAETDTASEVNTVRSVGSDVTLDSSSRSRWYRRARRLICPPDWRNDTRSKTAEMASTMYATANDEWRWDGSARRCPRAKRTPQRRRTRRGPRSAPRSRLLARTRGDAGRRAGGCCDAEQSGGTRRWRYRRVLLQLRQLRQTNQWKRPC